MRRGEGGVAISCVEERRRREAADVTFRSGRLGEGRARVRSRVIAGEVEGGAHRGVGREGAGTDEALEERAHRSAARVREPKEEGEIARRARSIGEPRHEVDRGPQRRWSRAGRERPRDERPSRPRARRALRGAIDRVEARAEVTCANGDLAEDEPAAEVALGVAEHRERGTHRVGERGPSHEREQHLRGDRDPVRLLELRSERDERASRRLAPRDASDLGGESDVRMAAPREASERLGGAPVARE